MHYGIAYIALFGLSKATVGVLSKPGPVRGGLTPSGLLNCFSWKGVGFSCLCVQHIQFY